MQGELSPQRIIPKFANNSKTIYILDKRTLQSKIYDTKRCVQ